MKRRSGFTLIELVMVIIILGILAVVAVPRFMDLRTDAKTAAMDGIKAAGEAGAQLWHARYLTGNTAYTDNYPGQSSACFDSTRPLPSIPSGCTITYNSVSGLFTYTTG